MLEIVSRDYIKNNNLSCLLDSPMVPKSGW